MIYPSTPKAEDRTPYVKLKIQEVPKRSKYPPWGDHVTANPDSSMPKFTVIGKLGENGIRIFPNLTNLSPGEMVLIPSTANSHDDHNETKMQNDGETMEPFNMFPSKFNDSMKEKGNLGLEKKFKEFVIKKGQENEKKMNAYYDDSDEIYDENDTEDLDIYDDITKQYKNIDKDNSNPKIIIESPLHENLNEHEKIEPYSGTCVYCKIIVVPENHSTKPMQETGVSTLPPKFPSPKHKHRKSKHRKRHRHVN